MDPQQFASLTLNQKKTMIIAMEVRNSMETFHTENLSDEQMKELNPLVRRGIIKGLELWDELERFSETEEPNGMLTKVAALSLMMIPEYWEVPDDDQYKKEMEDMENGK